jgi:hypothetical protein
MVKSADRFVTVTNIRLLEKSGGASGTWRRPAPKGSEDAADGAATGRPRPKPAHRGRPPKRT